MRLLVLITLGACGFSGQPVGTTSAADDAPMLDGPTPPIDGPPLGPLVVPHVPAANALPGAGPLILTAGIDTGAMTIGQALPQGVTFEPVAQPNGGPDLAILHAGNVVIPTGASVRVGGPRVLVIIAYTISVAGTLDVSARRSTSGPGANPAMGAGGNGTNKIDTSDSGGGGAGYGTKGARGGNACDNSGAAAGGTGGVAVQTDMIALLVGGAPGGAGGPGDCAAPATGGGGGGAIQLTGYTSITIATTGIIAAGGGGGLGGMKCNGDGSAGAGGGAGGAIVLNTVMLDQGGVVAANGGAGGGGGCYDSVPSGLPGADGLPSSTPAPGGPGVSCGRDGGDGGALAIIPTVGGDANCSDNAGGGGGAVGRIGFFVPKMGSQVGGAGTTSPAPHVVNSP